MRSLRLTALALLAVAAAAPTGAHAQTPIYGALEPLGCVVDDSAPQPQGCDRVSGLKNAAYTAVSADGRFLYVASRTSSSVTTFARDATTGLLRKTGCVAGPATAAELKCTPVPGLLLPNGLVVSRDGRAVYVAATNANALVALGRDAKTGALSPLGCFATGGPADANCTEVPRLSVPAAVAISPDDRHVYIGSRDGAILAFARAADGHLTFAGCVQSTSRDGCGPAGSLFYAKWLAVSPDGHQVYAADSTGNAVHAYARDAGTGALSPIGCWSGLADGTGRNGPCAPARGINNPEFVAVSPDGADVYVTGSANAIADLRRDPSSGALVQAAGPEGCLTDAAEPGDDCRLTDGLQTAFGLAFDPTGRNLYVGSYGTGSVGMFDRDPASGTLARHAPCFSQSDPACTARTAMAHAGHLTVSPDGRHVYAAAPDADAIQVFARTAAAPVLETRGRALKVRRGRATLTLTCPADALVGCFGSARVRILGTSGKPAGKGLTLAFDVRARRAATLRLRLDGASRRALRATRRDVALVEITSRSPDGGAITYPRWLPVRGG